MTDSLVNQEKIILLQADGISSVLLKRVA